MPASEATLPSCGRSLRRSDYRFENVIGRARVVTLEQFGEAASPTLVLEEGMDLLKNGFEARIEPFVSGWQSFRKEIGQASIIGGGRGGEYSPRALGYTLALDKESVPKEVAL